MPPDLESGHGCLQHRSDTHLECSPQITISSNDIPALRTLRYWSENLFYPCCQDMWIPHSARTLLPLCRGLKYLSIYKSTRSYTFWLHLLSLLLSLHSYLCRMRTVQSVWVLPKWISWEAGRNSTPAHQLVERETNTSKIKGADNSLSVLQSWWSSHPCHMIYFQRMQPQSILSEQLSPTDLITSYSSDKIAGM